MRTLFLIFFGGFFLIYILIDFIPTIYPRIERFFSLPKKTKDKTSEKDILNASLQMLTSKSVRMVWKDAGSKSLTRKLTDITIRNKRNINNEFRTYSYPRAFLLFGTMYYLYKKGDEKSIEIFSKKFDIYLTEEGEPTFEINKIDQVPFGFVSLLLYEITQNKKYYIFSENIYTFLVKMLDKQTGLIRYRNRSQVYFNDTLGMVIPFLVEYSKMSGDTSSLKLAKDQLHYFNGYGIDSLTGLPSHGINMNLNNIKVGSANWGRGFGWYFFALAWINNFDGDFKEEISIINKSLMSLRNQDGLWTQFPGSSQRFDASTSTMIIASANTIKQFSYTTTEVLSLLKDFIDNDGFILETSGDTYGLNNYSKTFGISELSQGFLLLTLSNS